MPARLRATLESYMEQMRLSLQAGDSMPRIERVLREFACGCATQAPEVRAVSDLSRAHIERYKRHLAQQPSSLRGGRLSKHRCWPSISARCASAWSASANGTARTRPTRVLMFAGDIPSRDEPLPRFIDDAAAKKLLRAARERSRPVHPPHGRVPRPHRASQGRVSRSHGRLGRADRRRVLAARPARQAAHRPLHPPAPSAQRPARRVGRQPAGRAARAVAVHGARPSDRQAARRQMRSRQSRTRPGSGT